MTYSRWATIEEFKEKLVAVNKESKIEKSGVPMMYDDNNLYIKDDEAHTMVIGSTGSGKTQSTLLPQLRLAIKAEESFIVHDVKGEIREVLSGELKKQNYNTVVINLDNPKLGNCFNPLTLPYKLYKAGDKDRAIELLENISHYFCISETINPNADPFWENSAMSVFIGLSLYLFENAKEDEINLNSIFNLTSNFDKVSSYVNELDKSSPIYINLSSITLAPNETKASIISVFKQQIKLFVTRESLSKLLSKSNFNIENIQKEKTAIFIITTDKAITGRLVPLIINECYDAAILNKNNNRRLNILIDEFEKMIAIKDFSNILTFSRSNNIKFTIFIKSLLELNNTYGKYEAEILKMSFGNTIYLLANDYETLQEISNLCGKQNQAEQLITVEELKLLDNFEAIILIPRINPIRTKLLPDYKIDWEFDNTKVEIPVIKVDDVKTYMIDNMN